MKEIIFEIWQSIHETAEDMLFRAWRKFASVEIKGIYRCDDCERIAPDDSETYFSLILCPTCLESKRFVRKAARLRERQKTYSDMPRLKKAA
jgi:DNA-directed RNA polymerase subunit RPC12/RpoP